MENNMKYIDPSEVHSNLSIMMSNFGKKIH